MNHQTNKFSSLKIIHFALISGAFLFLTVSFFTANTGTPQPNDILTYIAMIAAVPSIFLAFFIPKLLSMYIKDENINKKARYQFIKIIQWAVLVGASMLNAAVFFITGNLICLYAALIVIAMMIINYPSEKEMNVLSSD